MGWTKLFGDKQPLHEPESWSRTPSENMTGVELVYNDKKLAIYGPGEFWQSDSFECDVVQFGAPPVKLTHRRIEKLIDKECVGKVTEDRFGIVCDFRDSIMYDNTPGMFYLPTPEELPTWLILELDTKTNSISLHFSKERI
jgi:hypothetical protein